MPVTDETKARILLILRERTLRGNQLIDELKHYHMSMSTYTRARRELLSKNYITMTKKGAGRAAEYCLSEKGRRWLNQYLNDPEKCFKDVVMQIHDLAFGQGKIEVRLRNFKESYLSKHDHLLRIVESCYFQRFMHDMLREEVLLDEWKSGWLEIEEPRKVNMDLTIRISAEIPEEIERTWQSFDIMEKMALKWRKEHDYYLIANDPIMGFGLNKLEDRSHIELLCAMDYFCSRPEAVLECYLAVGAIPLSWFAKMKWPLLKKKIRDQVKNCWNESALSDGGRINPRSLWITSYFVAPEFDDPSTSDIPETWMRFSKYPPYKPDFKIRESDKIVDNSKKAQEFFDHLRKPIIEKWIQTCEKKWNEWFCMKPWRSMFSENSKTINDLAGIKTFDKNTILVNYSDILFSRADFDPHPFEEGMHIEIKNLRSLIHYIVRNNDFLSLYELLNRRQMDDYTWFLSWSKVREELIGPCPFAPPFYDEYRIIHAFPPFFQQIDKLYTKWLNAGKPTRTYYITDVVSKAVCAFKNSRDRGLSDEEAKFKMLKLLNEATNFEW